MSERKFNFMRSSTRLFVSLGLLIALALACPFARSQATQGSVIGVVKDAKGAVVPGAQITLTNTDLGAIRVTKSTGTGDYSFSDAVAGHYTLVVEFPGFEKFEIDRYKNVIYSTMIESMRKLIEMKDTLGLIGSDPDNPTPLIRRVRMRPPTGCCVVWLARQDCSTQPWYKPWLERGWNGLIAFSLFCRACLRGL